LRPILDYVTRTGRLVLDDSINDAAAVTAIASFRPTLPPEVISSPVGQWSFPGQVDTQEEVAMVTRTNRDLLHLISIGVDELRVLCAAGDSVAIRDLGYAFHNFPALLARPWEFDRNDCLFSFKGVAFHWDKLSRALKEALCPVMTTDLQVLDNLVRKEGFARSMVLKKNRIS
jgi:hypothetical protein